MSNNVRNFGVKNYKNQSTIPQLIANNMSRCFFSETRCRLEERHVKSNHILEYASSVWNCENILMLLKVFSVTLPNE